MRCSRPILVAAALAWLVPAVAAPQALTSLSSLRVTYTTRKNTAHPDGTLKAQLDDVDKQIADAARLGRTGEMRRLLAKGMTLLAGRSWTDVDDYAASLVVRTANVVADSSKPYTIRLEQIYSPAIELTGPMTAKVSLRRRPAPATAGAAAERGDLVKDLGAFDGVGRDLRESPFAMELDVQDVPDGIYQVNAEVVDEGRSLGSATLTVALRRGLDDAIATLERDAKTLPEEVAADVLYPVDRIRNANRGRIELRTFDLPADLAAAEETLAAAKKGQDPFAGRTGDFKRHYLLRTAGEIMPYHLYVPKAYTPSRAFPLIVVLHGLGATEDSFFGSYGSRFPVLAEQHGYIVAAPLGYRVDGFYGSGVMGADAAARKRGELSEQDVMEVLRVVRQRYNVDPNRIYLAGHSMGAIGTWYLGAKYGDIWAALAPISGLGDPKTLAAIRTIPEIIVHGDADPTVDVNGSRRMVAELKALHADYKYIEVPGGNHMSVAEPNFAAIFDFFDAHKKGARATQ